MKKKIMNFIKKPFVRNVIIMATGTAAAQAISMALSPFITRLYGPEAFGLMGVFMAIVGIVGPIACLTYPIAIVLPKSDGEAKSLIRLSLYISVGFAAVLSLLLLMFKNPIVSLFNLNDIAQYLYLIPIVVMFSGFLQVIENWLIRTKQFGVTAKATFLQAITLRGGMVLIGLFSPVASVLIFLSALGEGLKALMLVIFARKTINTSITGPLEEKIMVKEIASKYKDFPIFRAPQVFINAISQNLPVLVLAILFGPVSAGFYTIGRTVLGIPSQFVGKSVGDVFYPRITEAANNGENLTNLIKKATLVLGAIGLVPFGIVIVFGPSLFSFVFGAEWVSAGEYARWTAIWLYFMFINQPSIKALPVLSAQGFHLKFTIFTLVLRTGALVVGYYVFSSDLIAVGLFGVSGAVLNICLILMTLYISKNFDKEQENKLNG